MDREVLENIVLNGISGVDGICDMIKDCIDSRRPTRCERLDRPIERRNL